MSSKEIFVIMPFSTTSTCTKDEWDDIYANVFKPAFKKCNYSCERAKSTTGSLIKSIIKKLRNARIVLADITDQNPNVFYELGVRHSLSKRTIIVSQKSAHIPSDLKGYWTIIYGPKPGEVIQFKKDIKRIISQIEKSPEESDNPVSDYLDSEQISILNYVGRENIKKLGALSTEFTAIIYTLKEIEKNRNYKDYLNFDCLNILLNTLYVDLGSKLLKIFYELRQNLMGIKYGLRLKSEFISLNINLTKKLIQNILEIRNKIALGQFNEPIKVSTVIWEPVTQLGVKEFSKKETDYSKMVDVDKISLQDLKKRFEQQDKNSS